jgi:hypothetical protein
MLDKLASSRRPKKGGSNRGVIMKRLRWSAALIFSLLVTSAFAAPRDDVRAAMQRCEVIQDDRTWLDCIYGAQQPMRAKLGLTPVPDFQQRLVPPVTLGSVKSPAFVPNIGPEPRRQEETSRGFSGNTPGLVTSVLVGVHYDKRGGFIATLENGQVWRQINLVEGASKVRLTLGSKITIKRGSMWTYDLRVDRKPGSFKVSRES